MIEIFAKKQKISAVDHVIEEIKNSLLQKKLLPGDRLPNEDDLAQSLGVSRGSVRSAMKVFAACGVVEIKVGDGTYVCTEMSSNSFNPIIFPMLVLNPNMETLGIFREKIEFDILELIIGSPEQSAVCLKKLKENILQLKKLQQSKESTPEDYLQNDLAFHRILSQSCGNSVFQTVYDLILEYFTPAIRNTHMNQVSGIVSDADHTKIYSAIEFGDINMAQEAVSKSVGYWKRLNMH